jgi:hypothetical protein
LFAPLKTGPFALQTHRLFLLCGFLADKGRRTLTAGTPAIVLASAPRDTVLSFAVCLAGWGQWQTSSCRGFLSENYIEVAAQK